MMECPICYSPSQRFLGKYGYWIRRCQQCRHQFAELAPKDDHAAKVYSDHYFHGGGDGYPDYLAEAHILRNHGRRYGKLLARYIKPGRVLDVGAAAGFILLGLTDRGWQGMGVEPNATMATYARQQLGLDVQVGTLETLQAQELFDVVTMIQVVAHFHDLRQAFQQAADRTRSGGFWLIETWNCHSWSARLLGSHWHEYSPPSVLHWFSPQDLTLFAAQFGFRRVASGRPQKQLSGAHAKSLLRYKLKDLPLQWLSLWLLNLIPDRLTIPYPSEDLMWMLFEKQS